MHGQYLRQVEDKNKINTWTWIRKSNLKGRTETLICSASSKNELCEISQDKTVESPHVECVEWKTRKYHQ